MIDTDSMLAFYNQESSHEMDDCWVSRALITATEEHRASKTFTLSHFPLFRLASSLGSKRLVYSAVTGDAGPGQSYWIDQEHASLIGSTISRKHFDSLSIEFTTVATSKCWRTLAERAEGATVRELCISHKSRDEETRETCAALAYLCTKLRVRSFRLLAGDFEDGSINSFAECLAEMDNTTLQALDIRDFFRPQPYDRISHAQLDEFVISNRG
jgi:hypothetical protein